MFNAQGRTLSFATSTSEIFEVYSHQTEALDSLFVEIKRQKEIASQLQMGSLGLARF